MPSLNDKTQPASQKLILIGDSKAGKTGSVLEMANHGYRVVFADFDDKLESLAKMVVKPENYENVYYIPFREPSESQAKAYKNFKKALWEWEDLGSITDWGPETVFVMDSLQKYSKACLDNEKKMNPGLKDNRLYYQSYGDQIKADFSMLTGSFIQCHLIIIAHIKYIDVNRDKEGVPSDIRGVPEAEGNAVPPILPTYFNTVMEVKNQEILTKPSRWIDTGIPIIQREGLKDKYPVSSGLADIFKLLSPGSDK